MILDDRGAIPNQQAPAWGRATLDGILRKSAREHADRMALVDDPERESWNATPAQELTYAELDRRVDALAGFFRMAGLQPDAVIALDAPPTSDTVIILLAALRAGLIAFPVPSVWTRRDCMSILSPLAPKAMIVTSVSKGESRAERLRDVADTIRSTKLVFGYGGGLPGGVMDLAGSLRADDMLPAPSLERDGEPAEHIATITANGAPAASAKLHARAHRHWIASGLSFVLEAKLRDGASFLLPFSLSGLTGIGAGIVPWLLTAGTLHLHRFDRMAQLVMRAEETDPDAIILPGPLSHSLHAAGIWSEDDEPTIGAVWKDAHPSSAEPLDAGRRVIDVTVIDDLAFVARRREGSDVVPLPVGPVNVPSDAPGGSAILEIRIDGLLHKASDPRANLLGGLLSLRGMAVPTARSITSEAGQAATTGIEPSTEGFVRTDIEGRLADGAIRGVVPTGRHDKEPGGAAPGDSAWPDRPGRRAAL